MKNGNSTTEVACNLHAAFNNGVAEISLNTAPALETASTAIPRMTHAWTGGAREFSTKTPQDSVAERPKIPALLKSK